MSFSDAAILDFLGRELDVDCSSIDGATPLISGGLIDSLAVLQFVELIESLTGIKVASDEVKLENLDSMDKVRAYVARKTT
jgi:acyl carrier protein